MGKWVGIVLWIAFGVWLVILSILSSEDGAATAQTSSRLTAFVVGLFSMPVKYKDRVEAILRIAAHFILFFLLGGLMYSAVRVTWIQTENIHFVVWGICSVLGILDEVKKIFIAGRHFSWEEAGLNVIGTWCGIIVAMVVVQSILTTQSVK